MVFKTQLSQIDDKFKTETVTEEHLQNCVDFYVDFSKQFDKVILIIRENTKENAEYRLATYITMRGRKGKKKENK